MGLLKKLAGSGMFGVLGLAATHKLGGLARSGMFGIGGALLAGKAHNAPPPTDQPGVSRSPMPQDFPGDAPGYQAALNEWIARVTIPGAPSPGAGIGGAVNRGAG